MDDMRYDVAVVGAGQAGLAIGHALAEQKKRFVILEAADSVGSAWRNRWDSLVLFTPRRYDALPGLAFPGDPDGYPTRDEVAAYLERYAEQFELPIELSTPVRSLSKDADGFVLDANGRAIRADAVVVATGPFQAPIVPAFAGGLARRGRSRRTASATGARRICPKDACSSWAAATPASRSRRSWPAAARFTSRSAPARHPCRSACSAATSSGG